jgi:hypothetical protein
VPRSLNPTVVTVDAGPVAGERFRALLVHAYRDWEEGARGPMWLQCSADRPGVGTAEQ